MILLPCDGSDRNVMISNCEWQSFGRSMSTFIIIALITIHWRTGAFQPWTESSNWDSVIIIPPPVRKKRVCVRVAVYLYICQHISGTTRPIFSNFLCVLPTAVSRSSSGGVATRYVFPVLWLTSFLHVNKRREKGVYSNWLDSGQHWIDTGATT